MTLRFRLAAATGNARPPAGVATGINQMDETLVVIDLSMADDASILEDARKLYRARPRSSASRGFEDTSAGAASAQAQRLSDASVV